MTMANVATVTIRSGIAASSSPMTRTRPRSGVSDQDRAGRRALSGPRPTPAHVAADRFDTKPNGSALSPTGTSGFLSQV